MSSDELIKEKNPSHDQAAMGKAAMDQAIMGQEAMGQNSQVNAQANAMANPNNPDLLKANKQIEDIQKYMNLPSEDILNHALEAMQGADGDRGWSMQLADLAVKKDPKNVLAWGHIGLILMIESRFDAAIGCFKRALRLDPNLYGIWVNLSSALTRQYNYEEALECLKRAQELEPSDIHINLALSQIHNQLGNYEEALTSNRRAELLSPESDSVNIAFGRGNIYLRSGDYKKGFETLERRWEVSGAEPRYDRNNLWDGGDIKGQDILVWLDSTITDLVVFARFVPLLAKKGAKVTFEVPAIFANLFRRSENFEGINIIEVEDQANQDELRQMKHVPLISLVKKLGYDDIKKLPSDPYIMAPKAPRIHNEAFKVGIAWNGATRRNPIPGMSLHFRHVARLADSPNTQFYSLQKGDGQEMLQETGLNMIINDVGVIARDYSDIAGFCENLDLVIAVDCVSASIAAAMGKPVWLMLGPEVHWRWLGKRNGTPWFPSVKVFHRQHRLYWDDLVEQLRTDLISEAKAYMKAKKALK